MLLPDDGGRPTKHVAGNIISIYVLCEQVVAFVFKKKHHISDPLIRSVSRVIAALANVFKVVQLIFFLAVCICRILEGFGFVAFF